MYQVSKYPHGTFSWAENTSTDPRAAEAFYVGLFGWDKHDIPINEHMSYTMFELEGELVCALNGMMPDIQAQGIPSFWGNYVTVDDVDALVAPIQANGGNILVEPMDVFDNGRMAYVVDPTGAALGLWQARNHIGAGIVNTVGAMSLNELWTPDVVRAKAFYHAVFGWEYDFDGIFTRIFNRGRFNGGMLQLDDVEPMWLPHFHMADVEAGIGRVKALGGAVEIDMQVDADGSRWSVVRDPAGALFYIMEVVQPEPWQG